MEMSTNALCRLVHAYYYYKLRILYLKFLGLNVLQILEYIFFLVSFYSITDIDK